MIADVDCLSGSPFGYFIIVCWWLQTNGWKDKQWNTGFSTAENSCQLVNNEQHPVNSWSVYHHVVWHQQQGRGWGERGLEHCRQEEEQRKAQEDSVTALLIRRMMKTRWPTQSPRYSSQSSNLLPSEIVRLKLSEEEEELMSWPKPSINIDPC